MKCTVVYNLCNRGGISKVLVNYACGLNLNYNKEMPEIVYFINKRVSIGAHVSGVTIAKVFL